MNKEQSIQKLPDFAIIGAQKAGSTFLLEAIRSHADIFMPRSEVAFFEGVLFSDSEIPAFAKHFSGARSGQRIGFKRPNLLGHPEAAERMKRVLGSDLQMIAVLRNPIERAVSAYFHSAATGMIPPEPIEKGIRKILNGEWQTRYPRSSEILTFGLYGQHLAHYFEVFDRQNFCVVLLDDIRRDLDSVFQKLAEFLNLSSEFPKSDTRRRPMAAPYSLTRIRLKRAMEAPARTWNETREYFSFRKGPLWRAYLAAVRAVDKQFMAKIFSSTPPRISEDVERQLFNYYRDDIEKLRMIIHTDFLKWHNLSR